jgi:hypothetical protein
LFGIDFDKITLVHLISDTAAREKLEGAHEAFAAHDHRDALESAAVAFILVQRAHNRNQASSFPPHTPTSLRAKASRSAFTDFALHDLERVLGGGPGRSLRKIVEGNDRAIELLSEAIELISYGMDLKDYILFTSYIPVVHQFVGGECKSIGVNNPRKTPIS